MSVDIGPTQRGYAQAISDVLAEINRRRDEWAESEDSAATAIVMELENLRDTIDPPKEQP